MPLRGIIAVVAGGARGMGTELSRTSGRASTEGSRRIANRHGLNGSKRRTIVMKVTNDLRVNPVGTSEI